MKQYDVETVCTYRTWVRVDADDEKAAERKVKDMAWDMTRIQYPVSYTHLTLPTSDLV